jgi:hypothetical protein
VLGLIIGTPRGVLQWHAAADRSGPVENG